MNMEWKMNHAIVYPTVDCAIFEDNLFSRILLARKPGQNLYRFVGGFVDPVDDSYEDSAIREAKEETGLDCVFGGYVTSRKVNDPRYKDKEDKIITTLTALVSLAPLEDAKANDDIEEVKIFDVHDVNESMLMPEHRPLWKYLLTWIEWNYDR